MLISTSCSVASLKGEALTQLDRLASTALYRVLWSCRRPARCAQGFKFLEKMGVCRVSAVHDALDYCFMSAADSNCSSSREGDGSWHVAEG